MKTRIIWSLSMIIVLFLFGCASYRASFEQSNHMFFERTVDNLQVGKLLTGIIPRGSKISVRSLELDTTEDIPIVAILEDQMLKSIVESGFSVCERDEQALNHLYKESASDNFNVPKDKYSWLAGKEINIETPSLPEGSNWDYIQTNLSSADFVLCYRIQECGLIYEKVKGSTRKVSRNAMVRLHVRLYDARTGEIVYARNVAGTNVDTIPRTAMFKLAKFHYTEFYPYSYPQEKKEPKQSMFTFPMRYPYHKSAKQPAKVDKIEPQNIN